MFGSPFSDVFKITIFGTFCGIKGSMNVKGSSWNHRFIFKDVIFNHLLTSFSFLVFLLLTV